MARCALALTATAVALAAVDLAHKGVAGAAHFHARSAAYVAVVLVLAVLWAGAIVLTRSTALAVGGGIVAGGVLGNVGSLALWPGVPNPLELGSLAFNLADAFVLGGFVLVACTTLWIVRTDPARLDSPLRLR